MDYKKIIAIDYNDEYAFGEGTNFTIPNLTKRIKPKLNQGLHRDTSNSCTIAGALNQIIRLFGIELVAEDTNALLLEVVKWCADNCGYVLGEGRSSPKGTESAVKRWNEIGYKRFDTEKVFFVRLNYMSPFVHEALRKGHYVGFTYQAERGKDERDNGVVDGTEFEYGMGHRTNNQPLQEVNNPKSNGEDCERGVYDNYYPNKTNEYYIRHYNALNKKRNLIYNSNYLILPISCLVDTVEEEKKRIAEQKSFNAIVGLASSTYNSVDQNTQEILSNLATYLRGKGARERLEKNVELQAFVDNLSFFWKFLEEDDQITVAELAKKLRNKHNLL